VFLGLKFDRRNFGLADRYTLGFDCGDDVGSCIYYKDYRGAVQTWRNTVATTFGVKLNVLGNNRLKLESGFSLGSTNRYIARKKINGAIIGRGNQFINENQFGRREPYFDIFLNLAFAIFRIEKKEE